MENDEMCGILKVKFRSIGYLLYYSDLIKGNKMCGKLWNVRVFEVKFRNIGYLLYFTIVLLYREVKCVENDEMCGFLKLNFEVLDKNFTIVIL